jgi:hypothetical protein
LELYHGSNENVITPNINAGRNPLDFGKGFYLTSSLAQAESWARRKTALTALGIPIVNIYEYPDNYQDLSVKQFAKADEEYCGEKYDIVIGSVADDGVYRIIRLYMNGIYDREETIKRLKTETLDNQFVITSDRAAKLLIFKEAKAI